MQPTARRTILLASLTAFTAWHRPSWAVTCDQTVHQGPATYYDFADGSGVCGYPAETGNQMVVALDAPELLATALCGACIHVKGPTGEVTVLVVNGCPECEVGHLDLSPQAYNLIAANYNGVPSITWQYVPCDVTGPIKYAYYAGSSTNWAWVQVRNQRHPIAKFEARMTDGSYVELERSDWGFFKALNLPAGNQTYRVTDIYGQTLEDTGIAVLDEGEVSGKGQFPTCTGSLVAGGGAAGGAASTKGGGAGGSASGDTATVATASGGTAPATTGSVADTTKSSNEDACDCRLGSFRGSDRGSVAFLVALGVVLDWIRRRRLE